MLQTGPERSPNETSFFATAASRLGLEGCEKVACMAMRHMLFTYSCLYEKIPNLDEPLDGEDLSGDATLCERFMQSHRHAEEGRS